MSENVKLSHEKFCKDCGQVISEKAEICPKCGVRQINVMSVGVTAPNGKNRIAAILLAFFLGGIGAHKFYLGQVGMGIVYLLFCWTFIPSIAAFVEFIIYLTMTDQAFNEKYGGV